MYAGCRVITRHVNCATLGFGLEAAEKKRRLTRNSHINMMTVIVTATRTDAMTVIVMMMKINEMLMIDAWTFIPIYADG